MRSYWVTFTDHTHGSCDGDSEKDASATASIITGKIVESCEVLPYRAAPVIWRAYDTPSFCYTPEMCAGRRSCPHGPACDE